MSPTRPRQLLIDVTQYVSWPVTSGVQRVLRHLGEDWPGRTVEARFGFIDDRRYVTGPISELGPIIASTFRAPSGTPDVTARAKDVRRALRAAADHMISTDDVETWFDGYLLPEPSLSKASLDVATRFHGSRQTIAFFIYYDALPLTHPQFFPRSAAAQAAVSRYNRAIIPSENVAFISRAVRDVFEQRIARRKLANEIVARPGADGLRPVRELPSERPTFTVIGTVEPRKRQRVILEAFERLWVAGRDYRLVVLGAPGSERPDLIERLRQLSGTPQVTWIEQASDEDAVNALSRSSALLFTSDGEGYGLPPLEALAVGCPVIIAADLPALADLPSAGQIRLATVTADGIACAVETLADPTSNAAHRRAIRDLRLPTWRQFADDVEHWIASTLAPARASDTR